MGEYRIGRFGKGLLSSVVTLIAVTIVPLVLSNLLNGFDSATVDISEIERLLSRAGYLGVILTIAAFPKGFYEKGNKGRVAAWVVYTVLSVIWLLILLDFGNIGNILIGDEMVLTVSLTGAMGLIIVFKLLKLVVVYGDHRDHRAEFLEENDLDENGRPQSPDFDGIRVKGRHD